MSSFVNLMDIVYPVGSIYHTTDSTSPATRFGGTWSAITSQFLIGADDTYSAGSTGGEATHTLSVSEMPSHNHGLYGYWWCESGTDKNCLSQFSMTSDGLCQVSSSTGGGQAHNNLPPYYAVYIWKRTA